MSRIYTRTGDEGDTGLFGGGRVPKSDGRVAAYGEVDELNAVLGWAITRVDEPVLRDRLMVIQRDLFALGGHLATPMDSRSREYLPDLPRARAQEFEAWIDETDDELEPLTAFILPGGSEGGAALHLARTVCRRAERSVVELAATDEIDPDILVYLNRLSDVLFVLARLVNHRTGTPEPPWRPER